MARAYRQVELMVRSGNRPGVLAVVFAALARQSIDILAYCSYSEREDCVILLVTDDPAVAKTVLEAAGFTCRANPVVLVNASDQVGAAAELGACLGQAGINILYSYASSARSREFYAVFKTADDEHALRVLTTYRHSQAA